jgi:RND family efflux transporter MFP subunit
MFCGCLRSIQSFFWTGIGDALMVKDVNAPNSQSPDPVGEGSVAQPVKTLGRAVVSTKPDQAVVPAEPPGRSDVVQPTTSRKKWIWAGVLVAALVGAALWYFQPWVSKGLAVTVETITPASLVRVLAVNGRIAPLHLVEVKPTVGGAVTAVLADEGDVVKAGDILAKVDPVQQQAAVRQALAGLDAGLAALSQAEANLARAEALGGTIARKALEDAQTARQTAGQEVARLTALFDQTQIELAKYTLLAPMAGTILARHAEAGQVVDPATSMFTVADLRQLVVETDVDEGYAARILPGMAAVLKLKGGTEKLDGSVSFVAPQVDAATGGLAVKIAFEEPVVVPVGLTVTANIIVDQLAAAIAIPRAAVVTDAAGSAVFVVVAGAAVQRAVTIVDWPADRLEVTSGLIAGDIVITDAAGLSDGLAISVASASVAAP